MNIPDEMIERAVDAYRAPRLHLNDTVHDRIIDMRAAAQVIAEWARKEALDEVLCEAEKNRVITVTRHAGYTVENYADPLVKIAVLRALAEGVRS